MAEATLKLLLPAKWKRNRICLNCKQLQYIQPVNTKDQSQDTFARRFSPVQWSKGQAKITTWSARKNVQFWKFIATRAPNGCKWKKLYVIHKKQKYLSVILLAFLSTLRKFDFDKLPCLQISWRKALNDWSSHKESLTQNNMQGQFVHLYHQK